MSDERGKVVEERRPRHRFDQYLAHRRYQPTLSLTPDGSEIAYVTNTSGQFNLWRQSTDGGYAHQLTTFDDRTVREVAWTPDGETILFTADQDGAEFHQIYRIPAVGGWPEALTDAAEVQHVLGADAWSPSGRTIVYAGNDRDPTDQDVILRDLDGGDEGRPLAGDATFLPGVWASDGSAPTALEFRSNTNTDIHLIAVPDATTTLLTVHDAEGTYRRPCAADGSGCSLLTDEGREFVGLAFHDLGTGERRWVETPDWDVEELAVSTGGGRFLVWVVNEDGTSRLVVRDLASGELVDLPNLPSGVVTQPTLSANGRVLALFVDRADQPQEIYAVDIDRRTATRLTYGFLGGIPADDFVVPELIWYPTHDGRSIPAWLDRPRGAGPFPVVLSIHGGPEAQELPTYAGLYRSLLGRGIGVMAPNIRGSTSYGKTYQRRIHRDWGGAELGDLKAAADHLRSLPWVDAERLGLFGGSFGGFATLSCVSRLPECWRAAVDIVGPSNLVTLAKSAPPTGHRYVAAAIGDPKTEADFLMERSSITYVDRIAAPLFVIQGANDPRVVQAESNQIVERLRARGTPVRYDVYEDEGHGLTKRANELAAIRDASAFLAEHLLGR